MEAQQLMTTDDLDRARERLVAERRNIIKLIADDIDWPSNVEHLGQIQAAIEAIDRAMGDETQHSPSTGPGEDEPLDVEHFP